MQREGPPQHRQFVRTDDRNSQQSAHQAGSGQTKAQVHHIMT